jgi:RHS repeat-associated protein
LVIANDGDSPAGPWQALYDLAAPLPQVLVWDEFVAVQEYVYGVEPTPLWSDGSGGVQWLLGDGLGSVRQALPATRGTRATSFDSWGNRQQGLAFPFGFTGELHDGAAGLVTLRARWYNARHGTFTAVDPFAGFAAQPYSQHPYQYAYSNPVRWTDPSGRYSVLSDPIGPPKPPCRPGDIFKPFADFDNLPCDPSPGTLPTPTQQPERPKATSAPPVVLCPPPVAKPLPPVDVGYIEGFSGTFGGGSFITGGIEEVYDLYHFEYGMFVYGGGGAFTDIGASMSAYVGVVTGWTNFPVNQRGVQTYAGPSVSINVSFTIPFDVVGSNIQGFATEGRTMTGAMAGLSAGSSVNPLPIGLSASVSNYVMTQKLVFRQRDESVPSFADALMFASFIARRPNANLFLGSRAFAIATILDNGLRWESLTQAGMLDP